MTKLCANLTMLFNEKNFLERFSEAAVAGFKGVEYLFPYDFKKEELQEQLNKYNLKQVLFNLPAGDWSAGERGIAIFPERVNEFKEGVDNAIEYAKTLQCKMINVLAGIKPDHIPSDVIQQIFIENIDYAANKLKKEGIQLVIEAINTFDIPNFYVSRTQQALELIKKTGNDNIGLQYDIYHMQRMEGELSTTIKQHLAQIKHIQLADNPGRNEPGTGEINYPFLFKLLDDIGYNGWIGCEYKPLTTTSQGLSWAEYYL